MLEHLNPVPLDFQVWHGNIFPPDCNYVSDCHLFFDLRAVKDEDCRYHLAQKPHRWPRPKSFDHYLRELWSLLPGDHSPLRFQRLRLAVRLFDELYDVVTLQNISGDTCQVYAQKFQLALYLLEPDLICLGGKKDFKVVWFYNHDRPAGGLAAMVDK